MDKCYSCGYFDRYYTKGVKRFNQTQYGWCQKQREAIKIQDACKLFCRKQKLKVRVRLSLMQLNNLLTEISEVRKILEADLAENNEDESL